ncbi:MAG: prepilin-type N-terminal cleavage/methylation domain-containing protein [Acidobacteria bacterium]|nr:prepilin-type N-terminal cleavage/methylation domain-containing protein [Acidobacteriota bacterium]
MSYGCTIHRLGSSAPRPLGPSAPRLLSSSAPRLLSSSAPRPLGSSAPRLLGPSAPRLLGSSVRGFTLLELIIVLAIITVLLSVAIPAYRSVIANARESVLKQNLYTMRHQMEEFAADRGRYPQSLQEMVEAGYLREIPEDPISKSRETWQEVREESPSLNPDQPGIRDVKSGAEGQSLEGKPYSEL